MTLQNPLVQKKKSIKTYLVWRYSDVMSKTRKSPKIAKIMVFTIFLKQKLHFLAMMCVKVCLHMLVLQINQINKIKHSGSVSWKTKKTKTRFVCNFNGKSVFRCTQRAIMQRHVITLGPIFIKMVLNWEQGLKEKVKKFQPEKITTGRDITKNVEGGVNVENRKTFWAASTKGGGGVRYQSLRIFRPSKTLSYVTKWLLLTLGSFFLFTKCHMLTLQRFQKQFFFIPFKCLFTF